MYTQEFAQLTKAHGFQNFDIRARCFSGWVAACEGEVQTGIDLMKEAIAAMRSSNTALHIPYSAAMLADAHCLVGDLPAAHAALEEALRISARTGEAWFNADLHRRLALVLLQGDCGNKVQAESELTVALNIAREQGTRLFELRAATNLAQIWSALGRTTDARNLLSPVYASFVEGFGFPDLIKARELLERLGATPVTAANEHLQWRPPERAGTLDNGPAVLR
jgi:predicted ATPase